MSFDISRVTFDPWKDFSSVVMEQGRVQLDSDWNEWLAELTRRIRAGTLDTIGRAVYPAVLTTSFLITPVPGSITIGVGRMYVDGFLVENHGLPRPGSGGWIPPNITPPASQPAWDPTLDELVGQNPLDYTQQPYFPGVLIQAPFPTTGGPFIVFLDVWQRPVTFLEYSDLVEKAVGVDTTGRIQIAWQVRLLDVSSAGTVTCSTKDSDITPWENLIQPSAGRLTTGVVQSSATGPCCLAPNTGYTGMENQLYRVEIHQPGPPTSSSTATFKWSRNNASVATGVTEISAGGTVLTVQSTGKDNVLRFNANDWVEITDDWLELNGQHGELHQVALVTDSANTIKLTSAVTAASFPIDGKGLTDPTRHTRLVKWDQSGKVYQSDGTTVWADLDAAGSTGDIPVPPPGTTLIIENGATVSFSLNPTTGGFKIGDYWNFAARTVDGTIENLYQAPPRGIHHHYARLAMLTLPDTTSDCRIPWPPTTGSSESGCDCSSCVTSDTHNGGTWTIQQAIDLVLSQGGGKVCLGPGVYNIESTINIVGANTPAMNLAVCGHGLPTLLPAVQFSGNSIMQIQNAIDIDIDGLAFAAGTPNVSPASVPTAPVGLNIGQSSYVRVERCAFGLATDTIQLTQGISLSGFTVMDCTLRDNLFSNVQIGIGMGNSDRLLLIRLKIEDNQMSCSQGGFFLSSSEGLTVTDIRFANNFVQSASGFVLLGRGLDVIVEENTFSISAATASDTAPYDAAVVSNISQTRVLNNDITQNTSALSVTTAANNKGGLAAGTYTWVVTALVSGRELLLTAPATAAVTSPSNATLTWTSIAGANSYNVYRSVAGGSTLLLDSNVVPTSTGSVTFSDTAADASLQGQLPVMQNDGIVIGSPNAASTPYGTQVLGNRIDSLNGSGISSPVNTLLMATLIANNQLLNLGGPGIILSGSALDLDILTNSLITVDQLAREKIIAGIQVQAAIDVNISENRIQQVGPATGGAGVSRRGIYVVIAEETRIAGNSVVDVGPTTATSMGIYAVSLARLDIVDNNVRRSLTVPTKFDESLWAALAAIGLVVSVQGNLFESFGGRADTPGTVAVFAEQTCTFSNNQCFLDSSNDSGQSLVVAVVAAQSIIAMGNLVKGPTIQVAGAVPPPSMTLAVPGAGDIPPVTVIGNITSMGVNVLPSGMPAAMAPLNIKA